mmetsp:Transcript_25884/g.70174  ORF Transcript_25884/g.70174 Transcript_25884/m.70174 type:complete len:522 (-) Transcript_25884:719-2284(-)
MLCTPKKKKQEVQQKKGAALKSAKRTSVPVEEEEPTKPTGKGEQEKPTSNNSPKSQGKGLANEGIQHGSKGKLSKPAPQQPQMAAIRLATTVPPSNKFMSLKSNPRPPNAPPLRRLVLISSRVHNCRKAASSVLPDAAFCMYDWHGSLSDLQQHVEALIPPGSFLSSIAVLAPGDAPASVDIVEGRTASRKSLNDPSQAEITAEVLAFWKFLGSKLAKDGSLPDGGRRIDLVGCRMAEAPSDAAALLKVLWQLTSVPFACADEALRQYALATWRDSPKTGKPAIVLSTRAATDLYFDRNKLFADASLPGIPPGQAQAPPSKAAGVKDIFTRFKLEVLELQQPLSAIFKQYDASNTGSLSNSEVEALVHDVCGDVSAADALQIAALMDLDGNNLVSLEEFKEALDRGCHISAAVRQCRDDTDVVKALTDYFVENEQAVRKRFESTGTGGGGIIGWKEVIDLVSEIIDDKHERDFVLNYLYQVDEGDGNHSYDSVLRALNEFGTPKALAQMQHPGQDPGLKLH